jgi:para-aminobenzoate synthetase/4-amino-4-deoxychorismate lyase
LSRDCFALLDDYGADAGDRRSRLYRGHVGTLVCRSVAELPHLWSGLRQAWQRGEHALAIFAYELGADMHGIAPHAAPLDAPWLSQIILFKHCDRLSVDEASAWLAVHEEADVRAGIANVRASVDEKEFADAIQRIQAYIEAGDTYQVNYTWRLRFDVYGSALALYRKLRARQPVPYGALIALPDGGTILSLSPELFIRNDDGVITAKPMKGTAAASGDAARDAVSAEMLATDMKNRAENLMIVDLLRNDLGRIAAIGSVTVPQLFEVNRYGKVLQMTSTVAAQLPGETTLPEVFAALYPCGSITGAPKRRSMQIIRELEHDARGIYTGAIGWLDAPPLGRRTGNFCFSVPIRTLVLHAPVDGVRAGEMGVGAGIVHDSVAAAEWEECSLKADFLSGLGKDFELFETMFATASEGCRHLDLHRQRLQSSAAYFGFAYDEQGVREALRSACATLPDGPHRLRLALSQTGPCTVQSGKIATPNEPVKLLIASAVTDAQDIFLRHKTTVRATYDTAWRQAEAQGAFDMLFFNAQGELTEGGRSNVFVKLAGRWYTPPLTCGVLPGVMRTVLLRDPAWQASERRLTMADLRVAEDVVVCNALRGALRAIVEWPGT